MRITTKNQQQAAMMLRELEESPESPLKALRTLRTKKLNNEPRFSHFTRRISTQLSDSNCFNISLDQNAKLAGVSFFDGSLKIVSTIDGQIRNEIKDDDMNTPITSLSWHTSRESMANGQELLGACLDGSIIRWNKGLTNSVEHINLNEENSYHAIDCSDKLRKFCIAGSQPYIEIYDEKRMTLIQQIGDKVLKPAHTNKITTCKFNRNDDNMIYSGSRDRQVRFWDVRANQMSCSIGGKTSICGDAIDISHDNKYVVTGGGSLGEGVQLWDFRDLENPVVQYTWDTVENGDSLNPIVNCVRFLHKYNLVLVGCNDENVSAKCFDMHSGNVAEQFPHVRGSCFTMDVANDGSFCCFGDAEGAIHFENVIYEL